MKKATFFLGQGFDGDGNRIEESELRDMQGVAFAFLVKEFGGFTAVSAAGGWLDGKTVVMEPSLQVAVFGEFSEREWENLAKRLKGVFRQNEVMYTVEAAPVLRRI